MLIERKITTQMTDKIDNLINSYKQIKCNICEGKFI